MAGSRYPVAASNGLRPWSTGMGENAWPTSDNDLGVWGKNEVNPYLSSLRTQDVAVGTDRRTHYFGLATDSGGFIRGWAADIPYWAGPPQWWRLGLPERPSGRSHGIPTGHMQTGTLGTNWLLTLDAATLAFAMVTRRITALPLS